MYSSRLLNTKYGNEIVDLNKFLNFIENEPLIFEFIKRNNCETFDIENIIRSKGYHDKYQIPIENDREIAFVYQLLKYVQKKIVGFTNYLLVTVLEIRFRITLMHLIMK